MTNWRKAYDRKANEYYDRTTALDCTGDPGMTLQAPAEEQDINVIMKRFGVTDGSRIPRWVDREAMYGDFSDMPTDPVEAAEYIRRGNVAFAALPAEIRRNFDSGAHLYNWLGDENNREKATEMGLLAKKVSSNTSSDKGQVLVPPQNPPKEGENATA